MSEQLYIQPPPLSMRVSGVQLFAVGEKKEAYDNQAVAENNQLFWTPRGGSKRPSNQHRVVQLAKVRQRSLDYSNYFSKHCDSFFNYHLSLLTLYDS